MSNDLANEGKVKLMQNEKQLRMTIAENLRQSRLAAGLTQQQAAQLLGCTQSVISMTERGRRRVSAEFERRMMDIYLREQTPDEPCESETDDTDSTAVRAVGALVQLSETGGGELFSAVDNYIAAAAYMLIRDIYLCNPHNSSRVFSISGDAADMLRELIAGEPESIVNLIKYSRGIDPTAIEPDPLSAERLRRVIDECEKMLKG